MNEGRESWFVAVSHGDRLFCERVGEGPPVVLLPGGLMTDSRMWDHQMDFLSQFRTVLRYDEPRIREVQSVQWFESLRARSA